MEKQLIRFAGRKAMKHPVLLGYEGDNLVERLEFELPEITAGQTATLMIAGMADAVKLDRTDEGRYAVDLTRDMIGPDGEREAYVRIDGAGEKVWQSAPMRMITGALPDVEEEIEKQHPTAVGQMLTAMAEHSNEMQAQEERVEQAAQRAEEAAERAEEAAERAEAGGGGSGSSGSTVEIDTTLTQEGKAADAKATGDRIGQLSKEKVGVTAQAFTDEQKAQARENIGALGEEYFLSSANDILDGQNWIAGFVYENGAVTTDVGQASWYGYSGMTEGMVSVKPGKTYFYEFRVPANVADRLSGNGDKTNLGIDFCEYDSNRGWVQRIQLKRSKGNLPESVIEGADEVVRGEYIPGDNVYYVKIALGTYRADYDGSKVIKVLDGQTAGHKLLPAVSSLDDGKILRVVDGVWQVSNQAIEPTGHQYTGEKMPSEIHHFNAERVFTMNGTNITSQDAEVYGSYYFVACSGTEQIRVYSLDDNSWIADMIVDTHHGAGMQFSNEFYEDGDQFPLLYVGGGSSGKINVVRITNTDSVWSASIVRTIHIPVDEYGYYPAPSIDAKSNIMYTYGYKTSAYWTAENNPMPLARWDLDSLTDNGDGTYTPSLISRFETPYLGVTQGRKFYGGNLYVAFADTDSPHNARIVTIDAVTGAVKNDIDMTAVTTSEAEGLCYKIVGNRIYWYLNDYWSVYKLTF